MRRSAKCPCFGGPTGRRWAYRAPGSASADGSLLPQPPSPRRLGWLRAAVGTPVLGGQAP